MTCYSDLSQCFYWYLYSDYPVSLFVCLEFSVPLENFSLIWRRHHCRWRLQILTYARHSWPMSSEGSLTCHTHCDTGLSFIMVISEDPWHSHLLPSVWQWSCHYLLLRLRSVRPGIEPRSPACEANALPLYHRGGCSPLITIDSRFQTLVLQGNIFQKVILYHRYSILHERLIYNRISEWKQMVKRKVIEITKIIRTLDFQ